MSKKRVIPFNAKNICNLLDPACPPASLNITEASPHSGIRALAMNAGPVNSVSVQVRVIQVQYLCGSYELLRKGRKPNDSPYEAQLGYCPFDFSYFRIRRRICMRSWFIRRNPGAPVNSNRRRAFQWSVNRGTIRFSAPSPPPPVSSPPLCRCDPRVTRKMTFELLSNILRYTYTQRCI